MIRGTITEFGRDEGREATEVTVRAASKFGAVMSSRATATSIIPLREQEVVEVENLSNMRLFDQWRVVIRDNKKLQNVGR